MSAIREEAEVKFKADVSAAIRDIERTRRELSEKTLTSQLSRAVYIAWANNYEPVRFVLSRRVWKRLGGIGDPAKAKIMGMIPIEVDESTDLGFGLVTRPPQRETMQDQQGGANDH